MPRELLVGKVPVQHLFLCTCNFLEAHHAKVLDHELLDIEATQELVKLDVEHNTRGGAKVLFAFLVNTTASSSSEILFPALFFLFLKTCKATDGRNFTKLFTIFLLGKTVVWILIILSIIEKRSSVLIGGVVSTKAAYQS